MSAKPNTELIDLIIAGTDDDVIHRYATLAQRAPQFEAGLFEREVVILDTETTGVDPTSCELIQIAAARLSGSEVLETFSVFCKPTQKIPSAVVELTGITDSMVKDGLDPLVAVEQLAQFIDASPVVAHNANYDRTVLERYASQAEVFLTDIWYDSLALARIALPRLKSHALGALAAAFELEGATHRADADVAALGKLWRILLLALSELPEGFAGRMAQMHPTVEWDNRPIFTLLAEKGPDAAFSLKSVRNSRLLSVGREARADAIEMGPLRSMQPNQVEEAFLPGGMVSRMYDSYEPRPSQINMAQQIAQDVADDAFSVIEAGTGVGKSMAYLVPLAHIANQNNITVGVATKTNALLDQLIHHELPLLSSVYQEPLNWVALKGYEHYPCLRKLDSLAAGERPLNSEQLDVIAALMAFSAETREGDLDSVPLFWSKLPKSYFVSTSSECTKRYCPYYPKTCFLHGARQRAQSADIVVTNHSLLFRDVATDGALLPPIRTWVIDEAHSAESEARKQWACQIASTELIPVLESLGAQYSGILARLFKASSKIDEGALIAALTSKAEIALAPVLTLSQSFFSYLQELGEEEQSTYNSVNIRIDEKVRASSTWSSLVGVGNNLEEKLEHLIKTLNDIQSTADEISSDLRSTLSGAISRIEYAHEALKLILDGSDERYFFSAFIQKRKNFVSSALVAEYLDVGEALVEQFYPETRSLVFTSATLSVGNTFDSFVRQAGLDRVSSHDVRTNSIPSEYDYQQHMELLIPVDMPDPRSSSYLDALTELLFEVHTGMGGSTLTLFTNRREMESVYRRLKPRLAEEGLPLSYQYRGASAKRLRDLFIKDEVTSLLALKTFWEGFDAGGSTLRCVVVAKLPFPLPTDPLQQERDARSRGAWGRYALPEAVISVKQAAGRLIRSSTDTGCLVIADSRVISKNYGKKFIKSLPKQDFTSPRISEIAEHLSSWREGLGN